MQRIDLGLKIQTYPKFAIVQYDKKSVVITFKEIVNLQLSHFTRKIQGLNRYMMAKIPYFCRKEKEKPYDGTEINILLLKKYT